MQHAEAQYIRDLFVITGKATQVNIGACGPNFIILGHFHFIAADVLTRHSVQCRCIKSKEILLLWETPIQMYKWCAFELSKIRCWNLCIVFTEGNLLPMYQKLLNIPPSRCEFMGLGSHCILRIWCLFVLYRNQMLWFHHFLLITNVFCFIGYVRPSCNIVALSDFFSWCFREREKIEEGYIIAGMLDHGLKALDETQILVTKVENKLSMK